MRELHGAQRHGHGRLGRVDHGNPERLLQLMTEAEAETEALA